MPKISIVAGTTSKLVDILLRDNTSTKGAGVTGITSASTNLTAYYYREGAATPVAITIASMTLGTWATGGFIVMDGTNMPGMYQLGIPNLALAAGAKSVVIYIWEKTTTALNLAPCILEIELTAWDNQDAVHGGLTCLPNTAVSTNASLLTSGTGTDQLSVASGRTDMGKILGTAVSTPATAGILDVNAKNINNVAATSVTTINANVGTTQPQNFTGTAGSALVKTDMVDIAGAAVSTSTAQLGVNAVNHGGTAQTGRDIGASVLLSSGTGTGQLDITSGVAKANAVQLLGTAWLTPGVAGTPDVNAKLIAAVVPGSATIGTATNLTNAPTAGDFTATMKTSLNAATPTVTAGTVSDKTGYALTAAYDAAKTAAQAGNAMTLTAGERDALANDLLDIANGVETSITVRQFLRVALAALGGKADGAATTTMHYRDQADGKNRITATVDASGNRTAITLDVT